MPVIKFLAAAGVIGAMAVAGCTTVEHTTVIKPAPTHTVTQIPKPAAKPATPTPEPASAAPTPVQQPAPSQPPASQQSSPPPQPSQDAHVCLPAGDCAQITQENIANYLGITDPAGTDGCLVMGDCTSQQMQGIATYFENTGTDGF